MAKWIPKVVWTQSTAWLWTGPDINGNVVSGFKWLAIVWKCYWRFVFYNRVF